MDVSSAIGWWEEWQLRVLVLSSAFLQLFLFFTATKRALAIPSWLRLCIWLAYLGSDALAIYALATLFNRHKAPPGGDGSGVASASVLETLWAPVLLVHLGGPVSISAYNMEDNELWTRHTLTLLSQVTVSLYVFCRSWSPGGERLLLAAAVLLFIIGIIKFSLKPLALKRASINSLPISVVSQLQRRKVFKFYDVLRYFCTVTSNAFFDEDPGRLNQAAPEGTQLDQDNTVFLPDEADTLEEYVQKAKACIEMKKETPDDMQYLHNYRFPYSEPDLLADRALDYSDRLKALRSFLDLDEYQRTYGLAKIILSRMFLLLYSKEKLSISLLGIFLWLMTSILSLKVIGLFATSSKKGYSHNDVTVSYILLCSVAMIEVFQNCPIFCIKTGGRMKTAHASLPTVPTDVAQHNIMSFVLRKKKPTKLMILAAFISCDDYVNKYLHVGGGNQDSFLSITTSVLRQLEDGWRESIHDAASFKRFNDRRGQWTLSRKRHLLEECHYLFEPFIRRVLQWIPFDESVISWHLATDLCFHHPDTTSTSQESATIARIISNYMAYLLFLHPEMMMPGTRHDLFTMACFNVEVMLSHGDEPVPLVDETNLAQGIFRKKERFPLIFDDKLTPILSMACTLAKVLMQISDEKGRWELIEGVWVEMLCYSASRCSGYLHAKSLGKGSELLSYVWLLLSFMGMETYADRFQWLNPFEEGETDGGGSTRPEHPQEDETAAGGSTTSHCQVEPPILEEITTA